MKTAPTMNRISKRARSVKRVPAAKITSSS
jgi:hypothetical protein